MIEKRIFLSAFACTLLATGVVAVDAPTGKEFTNSLGMKFVRIEAGVFAMGASGELPQSLKESNLDWDGDFDERPVHQVTISKPFYLGAYEVTNRQYEFFDRPHVYKRGKKGFSIDHDEAVVFVSWREAQAFCDWLSAKEGLPYRLPTEAEWEYACRAGTTTHYATGELLPEVYIKNPTNSWYPNPVRGSGRREVVPLYVGKTPPNAWGLHDMHGNVEEWCADWYGPYESRAVTDPVGRVDGEFKVTRGGSHGTYPYYLRSSNRSGTIPEDSSWYIGLRLALGERPNSEPLPPAPPELYQQNVRQDVPPDALVQEDPTKPFFRGPREFVKIPRPSQGPLFHDHNHHPAVTECPNGDILAIWYSTVTESGREIAVAASRLRYGDDEWEPASPFWDAPDRNDHAPALWWDRERTIYHFNALSTAATWGPLAVVVRTSSDNGVTWTRARLAIPEHDSRHQVVESVLRTKEGFFVLPCDATPSGGGGTAVHVSRDGGLTWQDAGGTIGGIHAGVAQLTDGRLMAFGRGDEYDGPPTRFFPGPRTHPTKYRPMTQSVSADMGRTWTYSEAPFPPISGGQRVAFLRLQEGPLLVASFANETDEGRPLPPFLIEDSSGKKRQVHGLFAAVSYDDGENWSRIRLVTDDGPERELPSTDARRKFLLSKTSAERFGYLSVCQARSGRIHLVSSWNHYAFNLAWIESRPPPVE